MKSSIALVKQLRNMEFSDADARPLRAMFVAQAIAYHVPLNPALTVDQHVAEHEAFFLRTLNEVNEFLPVDTRLCRTLFTRLVRGRVELMRGSDDPALLLAALLSDSQRDAFTPEEYATAKAFCSMPTFAKGQFAVSEIIHQALAASAE